ncbi:ABC transporter substrate-binding protein [Salipiger sp. IMCC34102]|nr:ABC transporter substrate-binding protein [Salipiger sp. IMCC34102]
MAVAGIAVAQDRPVIDVGILSYGTAQWEMQVIQDNGLDTDAGIELVVTDLGSEQAGDLALQAGNVDVILTDFLWVSAQRNAGNLITSIPHSRAVGGVMVHPGAGIESLDQLAGTTIGIAGGPVDKSWIILQSAWESLNGDTLAEQVDARFAAPPLVNELLVSGDLPVALNFWHYNARARAAGMTELVSVTELLADLGVDGPAPLLVWAFTDETAQARPEAIRGFLDASFAAKRMLLEDDAVWESLRAKMRAEEDDRLFTELRDAYREGIIADLDPGLYDTASRTFDIMAEQGGADLVGRDAVFAEDTFWTGYGD